LPAFAGRADDVLNVAGHRIGTADVEGALVSHPAVAEAAVIGRPDEIKGENIKAFVILRIGHAGSPELEQKLKEHVRHVLGAIAVPAEIAFPDKLPKTRSGKIIRRLLKAQELGRDVWRSLHTRRVASVGTAYNRCGGAATPADSTPHRLWQTSALATATP
jgi:acetyl-CoA synthetase